MDYSNFTSIFSEKVFYLFNERKFKNVCGLFDDVCRILNLKFDVFYKEDVNFLGIYSCQIIIDIVIFLKVGKGSTANIAYQNSVIKFINTCLRQKKIVFQFPEFATDSFYTELKDSIDNIDLAENVKDIFSKYFQDSVKTAHLSRINSINYTNFKKKVTENIPGMFLNESYKDQNGEVLCSIYVNDTLLLQQGTGKNSNDSLEKTVTEFFKVYEIKEYFDNTTNKISNPDKEEILMNLSDLYIQKKNNLSNFSNRWDLIQDCINILNFRLVVEGGVVKINDIIICENDDSVPYVANIKAGQKLDGMLSKVRKRTILQTPTSVNMSKPVIPSQKMNKYINEDEREVIMKNMVVNAYKEYLKDQRKTFWSVLNQEFIKEKYKIEPRYTSEPRETRCTLVLIDWEIISGIGIDKFSSRDSASRNLVDKYLSSVPSS